MDRQDRLSLTSRALYNPLAHCPNRIGTAYAEQIGCKVGGGSKKLY